MNKPQAPKPTDPTVAIGAQTQSNAETARLQSQLNNVNDYGPYGSVTYQRNGDQWSRYEQPSADVLQQIDATVDAQNQALGTATRQIGRVDQALSTPLSLNGLPNLESEAIEPGMYGYDAQQTPQLSGNFGYGAGAKGAPQNLDFGGARGAGNQALLASRSGASMAGADGAAQGGGYPIQQVQGQVEQSPVRLGFDNGPAVQQQIGDAGPMATQTQTQQLKSAFDPGQQVQGQVGPTDFSADRQAVTDAVYGQARSRLDPMFNQQEDRLRSRLANQGISQNDAAYGNAMDDFSRGRNDAYNQALYSGIQQGAAEQGQLFGERVQQGQFANQAAGQEYAQNQGQAAFANDAADRTFGQNLAAGSFQNQAQQQQYAQQQGRGQFANQAAQQIYDRNQGEAGFYNQGVGQLFGQRLQGAEFANQAAGQQFGQALTAQDFANQTAQQGFENQRTSAQDANAVRQQMFSNQVTNLNATNAARGQALQERAYVQNQPINQLSTLLGLGSQVQMPQGAPGGNTGVSPTDVVGAYANYDRGNQAAYQSKMSALSGLLGGLGSVGSAAIKASDRRLKRDIVPLWKRDGLMWYAYRYVWSPAIRFGVMAQEVARMRPEAVVRLGPWLAVNYGAL
jgi:hypothetical protein